MSQHFPADILYALDNPRRRGHQVENHDASHVITPSAKQTHQYQHAAAGPTLPIVLHRPPFREPSAQAIAAGLRLAPPPYTTVELMRLLLSRKYGPVHMKCASSREVYVPRIDPRNVPKEITITIDRICLHVPDYLLAVHSSDAKEASLSPMIFPIRKLFVAMFCTNVIPFGPSSPTWVQVKDKEWEMTLPVSSIRVPDPPTFHLVLQYCYLRSQDMFFSAFIPDLYLFWTRPRSSLPTVYTNFMANCTSEDAIRALAVYLGTMFEPWKLFKYAQIVHRVWLNVCALGVFDEILWKVIEGCYQVLQRASWRPESTRPPLAAVNM